jgi:group I intron endonuclease
MLLLKNNLVLTIPLASLNYLLTILSRFTFLILIYRILLILPVHEAGENIFLLGGLFQTTLFKIPNLLGGLSLIDEPYILYSLIPIISTNVDSDKENNFDIQFKTWLISNKPVKVYLNSAKSKDLIYKENCSRSGVYLWYNNINGKYYIGSSINLKHRIYYYFSPAYLKKNKFLIQRALMCHTHNNFSLYILEYCEIKDLISREQYYIDLLTPPYNINPTAYSRLGSKHVEESKELMRINNLGEKNPMFGKTHSVEYKAILSERMINNNPMAGKPCDEKVKIIIKKVQSIPLYVYDAKTKLLLFKYDSQKEFIKVFKVSPKTVIKYINTNNPFREQYMLSNTLLDKSSI